MSPSNSEMILIMITVLLLVISPFFGEWLAVDVFESRAPFNIVQPQWFIDSHNELLDAICIVESNCDSSAIGDNGDSLGAYQIQYNYWFDAIEFNKSLQDLEMKYEDVTKDWYSRLIIISYWDRYGGGHGYSLEGLARQHVAGPDGYLQDVSLPYWNKIQIQLND